MAAHFDNGAGYMIGADRAPSPYHQQATSNDYYNKHPQQYDTAVQVNQPTPYSEGPTPASEGGEGNRGLLGALGGAGAGGYIGHQSCHGFLGTVGGAIVGSLTEDWARKKKPLCGSSPQSCHNSRPPSPHPHPAGCACDPCRRHYGVPPPPSVGHQDPYSPPYVDTQTTVNSSTHVHPGTYLPSSPPMYPVHLPAYNHCPPPPSKPCGHAHPCGCHFFGHHK